MTEPSPAYDVVPGDPTFAMVLGQTVWLMFTDPAIKDLPTSVIDGKVLPPTLRRQFKL